MTLLISSLLDTLTQDVHLLQIHIVAGIKLSNEAFVIENREHRLEADLVAAKLSNVVVV